MSIAPFTQVPYTATEDRDTDSPCLMSLPVELIHKIFTYLSTDDRKQLQSTCRHLYQCMTSGVT